MRAAGKSFESVERLETAGAAPNSAHHRRLMAFRTGKAGAPGKFRYSSEHSGFEQTASAIHQNEHRDDTDPDVLLDHSQYQQGGHADESNNNRDHQASRPAR